VVIPKSTKSERLAENLNIFDFELTAEDCKKIASLDKHKRYNDPGEFCKGMGGSYPIYG
jgi:diketogulonate reductase-like aldo/keto reductase